jgi:YjjG family noncanonical pyrimidine nucleotidase
MKKYSWLLFDIDQTLLDYRKAEEEAIKNTFQIHNYPFNLSILEEYKRINQRLWMKLETKELDVETIKVKRFDELFKFIGIRGDAKEFSKSYLNQLSQCPFLMDGAEEVVHTLSKDYNLGIITNGIWQVQRPRLELSNIGQYFDVTIISDEVGTAKPHPEIFDVAFVQMDNPPKKKVLMIGDSNLFDIQGGHNYGIDTCWIRVDPSYEATYPPTYKIDRISELPNILDSNN